MSNNVSVLRDALSKLAMYIVVGGLASYILCLLWAFVLVPFGAPDFTFLQTWGLFIIVGAFGGAIRGNGK
jgi:drug/metabolite transporter (DMT)-like permease